MLGPFQKPDRNVINETEKKIFLTDFFFGFLSSPFAKFIKKKKKKLAFLYFADIYFKKKNEEIWDQWQKMGLQNELL